MIIDVTQRTGGEKLLYSRYGEAYAKDMIIPVIIPDAFPSYQYCYDLENVEVRVADGQSWTKDTNNQYESRFRECTGLKTAHMRIWQKYGHYFFRDCTALQSVTLGDIGVDVTAMASLVFNGCTQSGLVITIYVDDNTAIPLAYSPWGATNATIVYRSSTTGEVRTV